MTGEPSRKGVVGMGTGRLFVISAPSGAGKSTLIERIRTVFPELVYSISCTTRAPRPGEKDGVHYYFMDPTRFRELIDRDGFLEWKEVHGHLYGTPAEPVETALAQGKRMILDVDVEGAREVFRKVPHSVGIFVTVPDMEELERRLRARGADSEETIATRMGNAVKEMQAASMFQYLLVNDDLDRAVEELCGIIAGESRDSEKLFV